MDETNRAQELQMELIELSRCAFVVPDLRENRRLWAAAMVSRLGPVFDLIPLRDLPKGDWNADQLFLLSSREDDEALEQLAATWEADEVRWIAGEEVRQRLGSFDPDVRVLAVWWD